MKNTQRDPVYKIDEFEDLTIFANESFDTQDVDLFEFSSEESSPLTRLKSIILSLDWEINDEILQELADELEHLESGWQGDKVAEIYLQGLSKIGGYIRSKGAYAHPNSIKLLLTFFYDFEKITSSQDITSEEITQLLTGDVRKFRILQYQINLNEEEPAPGFEEATETATLIPQPSSFAEKDQTKGLKAAILSLDWEVTDENLKQFNAKLSQCRELFLDNKPASILVHGLQVLGDYIDEKRADTHPEAFPLLHSFSEALEQIVKAEKHLLDQDAIQEFLMDRINGINNLKMLVAGLPVSPLDAQAIDTFVEGISSPGTIAGATALAPAPPAETEGQPAPPLSVQEDSTRKMDPPGRADALPADTLEAEIDTLFAMEAVPAMETADSQYPDEVLPPDAIHPLDDELADDFIEASLSASRGIKPALSDTDEISGFNEEAEPLDLPAQIDLAEQLDFLFPESDTDTTGRPEVLSTTDSGTLAMATEVKEEPVAALSDVFPEEMALPELEAFDETEEPGKEAKIGQGESAIDQTTLDIQSKLDDFFADVSEEPAEPEAAKAPSVEEIEQSLFFNGESKLESALADSEEEHGFSEEAAIASLEYTPMGEIEEKLDFFFGTDTEEEPAAMADEKAKVPGEVFWEEEATVATADMRDKELEGAIDFFFEASEDDEEETAEPEEDELTQALEATLGDRVAVASDLLPKETSPASLPEETREIQLASLGALLPGVVRSISREKVAETTQRIAILKETGLSSEQQSLAQMLDSVVNLLLRLPRKNDAATERLVNYLFEHLLDEECRPEVVPEAVRRFTIWLQEASTILPTFPAKTGEEAEPRFEYTAKELYVELSELRGQMNEEFAKLRHELHHKH